MNANLKEIIVAYFNGGNAVSGNNKKLSEEIRQDLEVILNFYQANHTEKE